MIEKREYQKALLEEKHVDSQEFLKGDYNEDAKERIVRIIDAEAPITNSLLSKRLINSYGILRLGSLLNDMYESIIKELETEERIKSEIVCGEKEFYKEESCNYFRPTPDDPEEIRYSYQIPVTEALNVIIYVLENSGKKLKKKEILELFSKELEYLRKGSQVVSLFNKAFDFGKKKGVIKTSSSGKFSV